MIRIAENQMSLLSPGKYLRSKLIKPTYEIRNGEGNRIEVIPSAHCSFLISAGVAMGKLDGSGDLECLIALRPSPVIRRMLKAGMAGGRLGAEDNKTTFMDGKTFTHHMRKSRAFA